MLTVVQHELVEDWAVDQIMPDPNLVNLFDDWWALLRLCGHVRGTRHVAGHGAVSAGLIVAVGIKLMDALKSNPIGRLSCTLIGAITFVTVGLLRLPLAWVLLTLGPLTSVWAAHCIKHRGQA